MPSDNFNGITVGISQRDDVGPNAVYRVASPINDFDQDAEGLRTSISLLAPGEHVRVIGLNDAVEDDGLGSSYSAPHVTGAVGLLHQYAKYQQVNAGWSADARRHEVMKAILLNSADKKAGVHGSTRDVENSSGVKWVDSTAYFSESQPLDVEMGAGHLNVTSALTNLKGGQHSPFLGTVPLIGWDYNTVSPFIDGNDYIFDTPLAANSWVAITLTWDRLVENTEASNTYNSTTEFFSRPLDQELSNLSLYLMEADSDDLVTATRVSFSDESNVEHIFYQVPNAGEYKIKVLHNGGLADITDYGLAWWAGESTSIEGDFDEDGDVDDEDLTKWKMEFGPTYDGNDFLAWQRNYGFGVPATPASAAVPEPAACLLALIGLPMLLRRRRSSVLKSEAR